MFVYQQLDGVLLGPDGKIWGIGYSGKGDSKNNPIDENLVGKGPIPTGNYKIVGPLLTTLKHGPDVLRLLPDELTKQAIIDLGRDPDSFLMHGDSISSPGCGSEGCIVMPHEVRVRVWNENKQDGDLTVVAI